MRAFRMWLAAGLVLAGGATAIEGETLPEGPGPATEQVQRQVRAMARQARRLRAGPATPTTDGERPARPSVVRRDPAPCRASGRDGRGPDARRAGPADQDQRRQRRAERAAGLPTGPPEGPRHRHPPAGRAAVAAAAAEDRRDGRPGAAVHRAADQDAAGHRGPARSPPTRRRP